eukprot:GHUV01023480.1.p1 GENE.GHUV01023480.1~~GHUV01023480.1.p1  ORF type:complete len:139 (-),score=9.46 GHUV01023480.1:1495-1911(-)
MLPCEFFKCQHQYFVLLATYPVIAAIPIHTTAQASHTQHTLDTQPCKTTLQPSEHAERDQAPTIPTDDNQRTCTSKLRRQLQSTGVLLMRHVTEQSATPYECNCCPAIALQPSIYLVDTVPVIRQHVLDCGAAPSAAC